MHLLRPPLLFSVDVTEKRGSKERPTRAKNWEYDKEMGESMNLIICPAQIPPIDPQTWMPAHPARNYHPVLLRQLFLHLCISVFLSLLDSQEFSCLKE